MNARRLALLGAVAMVIAMALSVYVVQAQTTTPDTWLHPFLRNHLDAAELTNVHTAAGAAGVSHTKLTGIETRLLKMEESANFASNGMKAMWYREWRNGRIPTNEARRWISDIFAKLPNPANPNRRTAPEYSTLYPNVIVKTIR